MSNAVQLYKQAEQIVQQTAPNFRKLAEIHGAVHFEREASFACQILRDNSFLLDTAMRDKDSLISAVLNVAAVGLTLSPVFKYAYLVPRDKKIRLDISYEGLKRLAMDMGTVEWVYADVVRQEDIFQLKSFDQKPVHEFAPFTKRGEIIGAYCCAKLSNGDFITVHMDLEAIYKIRNASPSYKAYKKDSLKLTPWVTNEEEMIKKTLIRRGWKSWPKAERDERLAKAIDVISESESTTLDVEPTSDEKRQSYFVQIRERLGTLNRAEDKFVEYLKRTCQRDLSKLEDLTEIEAERALASLDEIIAIQMAKAEKAKGSNDVA